MQNTSQHCEINPNLRRPFLSPDWEPCVSFHHLEVRCNSRAPGGYASSEPLPPLFLYSCLPATHTTLPVFPLSTPVTDEQKLVWPFRASLNASPPPHTHLKALHQTLPHLYCTRLQCPRHLQVSSAECYMIQGQGGIWAFIPQRPAPGLTVSSGHWEGP